jgi:hypothetical protein
MELAMVLITAPLLLLVVIPFWCLLPRAGIAAPWALLAAVPVIGALGLLWVIAFRRWPMDDAFERDEMSEMTDRKFE